MELAMGKLMIHKSWREFAGT